jgi:hypothetical protein
MAGALPSAAQDALSDAAAKAGFSLPHSDNAGQKTSDTTEQVADDSEADDSDAPKADTHGDAVSAVAHDETLTGREKGKAVSAVAKTNGVAHKAEHAPEGGGASHSDDAPDGPDADDGSDSTDAPDAPENESSHGGGKH